ncbi:MAG: glycosyltransferase [Verrucomicrobiota bacterium]
MGRIAYIFTTFPKLSEQFFMREVLELQRSGLKIDIYSLIGGAPDSEAGPVIEMNAWSWICFVFELFYWLINRPKTASSLIFRVLFKRYGSWTNYGENLIGLAFALRFARSFKKANYAYAHATWATAPGMAAFALRALIGQRYTLEAHAYDVFRNAGDAFLLDKLNDAWRVRSSTEATTNELRHRLGNGTSKALCVRRGLSKIPDYRLPHAIAGPIKILSVGRLIEKKGYVEQLAIYGALKASGTSFQATIIGDGPLHHDLQSQIKELGLEDSVTLVGRLDYPQVEQFYLKANLFLFTGKVSASGDRDGFPNVIAEAMSFSVPVFSTDVSGVGEGIRDGITGYIINNSDIPASAKKISYRICDLEETRLVSSNAHQWIKKAFSVVDNMQTLRAHLWPDL